jgi:hypothetical protein
MKFKTAIAAACAVALSCVQAFGQASILPPGEVCFQATTGINGMVGLLGTITGGSLYTNGTYGGVSLTGGSGSGATANITVSGGVVTTVAVLNPGIQYVAGDVLSASAASIGGTGSGFSVPVSSISINSSLAGGTVGFYIPNTLSTKQTWQNSGETVLNTNPVGLDANGCALIYGAGIYRQILKDSLGNTVWDQLTAATGAGAGSNGIFWASLAGGTGNAITVVDTAFSLQDGYNLQFLAKNTNNGPTTISVSGGTPIAIVNDLSTGPAALTGGEIGPGNTPMLTYDATNVEFHIVNPAASNSSGGGSGSLAPPQGYLNLVGQASGDVIQTGDVISATTVYYSPFVGNTIPIWNGSAFIQTAFSELTATLTTAGSPLNAIQDACVFSNNGVPTLAIGPAWTTPTAGAGNRGTGAGTAQLSRLNGLWVNAVQIVGYNGLSSFTISANRCTYVGSLSIDGTAGQVTAHRTYGQSRKFGVWNAYNRQAIYLKAGDSTASWSVATSVRPFNGNTANSLTVFSGLPEETFSFYVFLFASQISGAGAISGVEAGVGFNSTSSVSGFSGLNKIGATSSTTTMGLFGGAKYLAPPTLGINVITGLETSGATSSPTASGGESNNLITGEWRG